MSNYYYFVVTAAGKSGTGESVAKALANALTRQGFLNHYASTPRIGFHWGKYESFPRSIRADRSYEMCEVHLDSKKTKHIMTVYRSVNIAIIAKLNDQYGQANKTKTTA